MKHSLRPIVMGILVVSSCSLLQAAGEGGVAVAQQSTAQQEQTCPICTEPASATRVFETTPCGHSFCRACLSQWLNGRDVFGQDNTTCPMCRAALRPATENRHSTIINPDEWLRQFNPQPATQQPATRPAHHEDALEREINEVVNRLIAGSYNTRHIHHGGRTTQPVVVGEDTFDAPGAAFGWNMRRAPVQPAMAAPRVHDQEQAELDAVIRASLQEQQEAQRLADLREASVMTALQEEAQREQEQQELQQLAQALHESELLERTRQEREEQLLQADIAAIAAAQVHQARTQPAETEQERQRRLRREAAESRMRSNNNQ